MTYHFIYDINKNKNFFLVDQRKVPNIVLKADRDKSDHEN
jgi:hypothetical protein